MGDDLLIDISAAINQRAGIGRYARELTQQLIPILDAGTTRLWYAEDESMYDAELLTRHPWRELPVRRAPISRLNVDRLVFRESLPFARFLRVGQPKDVYSPDFTAPAPGRARTHITVHDLAWLHPEAETPPPLANFLAPVVERSVRSATTVFTVSETIREEVIERYTISGDRVVLAPNAAAPQFFEAQPLSADALLAFGLRKPFLLAVGTIEPRKNLTTLFEALAHLPSRIQLALSGRPGWRASEILGRIDELGSSGQVVHLGFVPDDVLPRLMASADVVIYPSRYEGFGLPIVEALATGAPVIASRLPVFREVGGDLVDYVAPTDPVEIAAAIEHVLRRTPDADARRGRKERARQFTWSESAEIVAQRLRDAG
ncbi:MAG: glycosyltransferase family 4 protein [Thermomicrobiales bacterium]|nr:glycosyltransferase family 4 protein [Thermomicrobiales bacterium]